MTNLRSGKHYRDVSIDDVVFVAHASAGADVPLALRACALRTVPTVARWIETRGPALLSVELREVVRVNPTNGLLLQDGARQGTRLTAAITGYDATVKRYRVLMPFGVAWGQGGRCWVSADMLGYWLSNRRASVTGVVRRAGTVTEFAAGADRQARVIELV